ncbi:regulator of G-protein signaling 9-binding protein-like [Eriocheir sinensis]|uniref:regulator of G-protein signaling 9-binding protein-like n=1 Tax=Eriocheir sinensis TaxID=95602 RepID=UPI0021CA5267|nr:regulator of G-protein signaling 9-binding protein-like [Eriocheir sinensis]
MWGRGGGAGAGGGGGGGSHGSLNALGGGPAGGLAGRTMWIPYCSHPDTRNLPIPLEFAGKTECLKLIRELNRETSSYRHLAVGLGGSGDCEQLRDELKRSRRRAQDIARQAKNKLNPYLLETDPVRPEVARLWRILFCCIRVLEQEMLRTLTLQHTFGLHLGPVGLINTGVHEYGGSHRPGPPPLDGHDLPLDDRQAIERAEVNQLHKELIDLRNLINVMESSLDLKAWAVDDITEKQLLAAINDDSASFRDNYESGASEAESGGDESVSTLQRRRYICYILSCVVAVFLLGTILGILLAVLT